MAKYYYIDSNKQKAGPLSVEELIGIGIVRETPVWTQGMANWTPAGDVDDFKGLFNAVPPYYSQQGRDSSCNTCRQPQEPLCRKPDSWLVWSILCTLFCSHIFGILGIVFACQVDTAWNAGRYEEARSNAKKAKLFSLIGIGINLAIWLVLLLFYFGFFLSMCGVGLAANEAYAF